MRNSELLAELRKLAVKPVRFLYRRSERPQGQHRPCQGNKSSYTSRRQAKEALKRIRPGFRARIYLCDCGLYHLTNQDKRHSQ